MSKKSSSYLFQLSNLKQYCENDAILNGPILVDWVSFQISWRSNYVVYQLSRDHYINEFKITGTPDEMA